MRDEPVLMGTCCKCEQRSGRRLCAKLLPVQLRNLGIRGEDRSLHPCVQIGLARAPAARASVIQVSADWPSPDAACVSASTLADVPSQHGSPSWHLNANASSMCVCTTSASPLRSSCTSPISAIGQGRNATHCSSATMSRQALNQTSFSARSPASRWTRAPRPNGQASLRSAAPDRARSIDCW